MSAWLKVSLVLVGAGAGAAAGYYIATTRAGRQAIAAAEEAIEGARLPDPSFAMDLPYTEAQFKLLDDLVCECGDPIIEASSPNITIDDLSQQIQDCMALELYPDFPWPPMAGDHPSVTQLYAELGVIARRALATGKICPSPLPSPTEIPVPRPNPGAYAWPRSSG